MTRAAAVLYSLDVLGGGWRILARVARSFPSLWPIAFTTSSRVFATRSLAASRPARYRARNGGSAFSNECC